jgi:biotin operon repressor
MTEAKLKQLIHTIPEIADTVGISKTAVQNNIKKLKNKGLYRTYRP